MLRGRAGGGGKEQRGREMAAGRGRKRGKGSRERVEKEQPGRETMLAHGSPAFIPGMLLSKQCVLPTLISNGPFCSPHKAPLSSGRRWHGAPEAAAARHGLLFP